MNRALLRRKSAQSPEAVSKIGSLTPFANLKVVYLRPLVHGNTVNIFA